MKTMKILTALMAIVFGLDIAACCGGGTTTVQERETKITSPTVVDELQDLDNAYKNGSITKEEYEKLRQDIVNNAARQPR